VGKDDREALAVLIKEIKMRPEYARLLLRQLRKQGWALVRKEWLVKQKKDIDTKIRLIIKLISRRKK
jgi:hypothetical protein